LNNSFKEAHYGSYIGRVARGAGIGSFGIGIGRVLLFATQVALARMYGPTQLGFYVLGSTLAQIAKILGQFGLDNGLVRYVARYQAERDISRVRGTILLALGVGLGLSLILSGLMFFGAGFLTELLAGETSNRLSVEAVFRVFSLSIPLLTVMSVALWATQGFQTVKYATYVEHIALPLINLALVLFFYFLTAELIGAVTAYAISAAVCLILALFYLRQIFPELLDWEIKPRFETRALLSSSGPMLLASYAPVVNSWSVIAVLGVFASAKEVGIFNAASRTAVISSLVLVAFGNIFAPIASNLYTRGLLEDLGHLYKDVSRWVFTASLAIFLCTVLLARDVMVVFGDEFISSWPALVVLTGAELYNNSVGPEDRLLAMIGQHRVVVMATVGGAVAAFGGSMILIPLYGIWGATAATAGGIVLAQTTMIVVLWRAVNYWPYDRQFVKPLVSGLLAASLTFLAKSILPLPANGLLQLIIFGPCLLTCYGTALLVLGLSPSDKQLLKVLWRAVWPSKRGSG